MVMPQHFFCSELSREDDEKLYGTAPSADAWLLLEYDKTWGRKALDDSDLNDAIKSYLSSFLKRTPAIRLLFIKREQAKSARLSFFIARCRETRPQLYRFALDSYEQLLEIDILALVEGRSVAGAEEINQPLFLICAHGSHDRCCAKYGLPIYRALKGTSSGEVWQASHVGGDRFAANMICFPHAIFYGRVSETDAQRIIAEYHKQQIYLKNYRGRGCFAKPLQAAEFFARSETGLTGIGDLCLLDSLDLDDRTWQVSFKAGSNGDTHEVTVVKTESAFRNFTSCRETEEKSVEQYLLERYRVVPSNGDTQCR